MEKNRIRVSEGISSGELKGLYVLENEAKSWQWLEKDKVEERPSFLERVLSRGLRKKDVPIFPSPLEEKVFSDLYWDKTVGGVFLIGAPGLVLAARNQAKD